MSLDDLDIPSLPLGHLPVIRACLDQFGVFAVLDEHLPQHPQAHAADAQCLAVMALKILSGRVVLWRMDQRFEHVDLELLLGDGVQASWFHDNLPCPPKVKTLRPSEIGPLPAPSRGDTFGSRPAVGACRPSSTTGGPPRPPRDTLPP
jgi:hypothetical protein